MCLCLKYFQAEISAFLNLNKFSVLNFGNFIAYYLGLHREFKVEFLLGNTKRFLKGGTAGARAYGGVAVVDDHCTLTLRDELIIMLKAREIMRLEVRRGEGEAICRKEEGVACNA